MPHFATTLVDLLRVQAHAHPDLVAYTFLEDGETEQARWTYRQVDQQACAIAAQLQSLNMVGERALLLYPPGLDFIAAFFGCLYAKVIAVPVYPPRRTQHLARLQAILMDAQAKLALTTASCWSKMERWLTELPDFAALRWLSTDILSPNLGEQWRKPDTHGDMLAFLQYTSGSTGRPKGVMVSHENLLHNSAELDQGWRHTPDSAIVTWLPTFHDMGLIYGVIQPLYKRIPCYMMAPGAFLQRPIRWLQTISRYQATHSGGPNFAYDFCVDKIVSAQRVGLDLQSWRMALNGAEPVRPATLDRFAQAFQPYGFNPNAFCPGYGLAESTLKVTAVQTSSKPVFQAVQTTALTQHKVAPALADDPNGQILVSCGRAMLDTQIVIVDPERSTQCRPDRVGEIWVASPSVAQGYWQRSQETRQTFQAYLADTGEGPFLRTGDLGFLKDGELFVTGRLKDIIIMGGVNYYPQDIELTVERSHPALRPNAGAAFAIEVDHTEQLVIVQEVERRFLRSTDLQPVISTLRQAIAENYDLAVYAVLLLKPGSIPKTSSGKIQRSACRAGFLAGSLNLVQDWTLNLRDRTAFLQLASEVEDLAQRLSTHHHKPTSEQSQSTSTIQSWLVAHLSQTLQLSPHEIEIDRPFAYYGLASKDSVGLTVALENWLGRRFSPTLAYDYPSIRALAEYLARSQPAQDPAQLSTTSVSSCSQSLTTEPIAVIGLGCRFPGASNPEQFWMLLQNGVDAITEVPPTRWQAEIFYDPDPDTVGKMNTRWGGFLHAVDQFDPQFFNIAPREAANIDPQQRLLLEVAWEALEHAGQAPERLAGSSTGVFVGIASNDYAQLQFSHPNLLDAYAGTGSAHSLAANRLSYLLDLRGPSLAVDTACSASLVAVHLARQNLQSGDCDLAIAAGVNLILTPQLTIALSKAHMMAADGRCKPFDARADGYVRSEGCGVVILKRLSDALKHGDRILAVLQGSAVNEDGCSNGLTAPNGLAQQAVIQRALQNAGVPATQLSYVETHGTGTSLGDPIEVNALKATLLPGRSQNQPCWMGSVKANIGHLEAAAGIAGFIKVVLALQHRMIPPQIHLQQLNPLISLEDTPLSVPTQLQPWVVDSDLRWAGISSFSFGGTNAHAILAETPQAQREPSPLQNDKPLHLLTLSAKGDRALRELTAHFEHYCSEHSQVSLADVCFTASTGRSHFNHRLAAIADSLPQMQEQLQRFIAGEPSSRVLSDHYLPGQEPKIAFLFTGQGCQYIDMGRQLYEIQPTFRRVMDHCDEILQDVLNGSLLEVIYPDLGEQRRKDEFNSKYSARGAKLDKVQDSTLKIQHTDLNQTAYTQPALFALEYALAQVWMSWGIQPDVVMGHSVGEYVAACVAGVFSLEEGLKLIAQRAALMQALPQDGEMLVVFAGREQVEAAIEPYAHAVAIAALNGAHNIVISGERRAIRKIRADLETTEIKTKLLRVSHAFHSPLIETMLPAFERVASKVSYASPHIPLVSNLTGELATADIATPQYWVRHVRHPVQFTAGMQALMQQECDVLLEVGPQPSLLSMGYQCFPKDQTLWLSSLRLGYPDWRQLLHSLGKLYVRGAAVDWMEFGRDSSPSRVDLPTYPFQRQLCWLDVSAFEWQSPVKGKPLPSPSPPESHLVSPSPPQTPVLLQRLLDAAPSDRLPNLIHHLQQEFAIVLGIDPTHPPDPTLGFVTMGLDSLMAMELKRRLENSLGQSLSPTLAFNYPTIETLANYLLQDMLALETSIGGHPVSHARSSQPVITATQIAQLSEAETEELLLKTLETL